MAARLSKGGVKKQHHDSSGRFVAKEGYRGGSLKTESIAR